jgi:hypothetical protein
MTAWQSIVFVLFKARTTTPDKGQISALTLQELGWRKCAARVTSWASTYNLPFTARWELCVAHVRTNAYGALTAIPTAPYF